MAGRNALIFFPLASASLDFKQRIATAVVAENLSKSGDTILLQGRLRPGPDLGRGCAAKRRGIFRESIVDPVESPIQGAPGAEGVRNGA
jgi:hypothetical protein